MSDERIDYDEIRDSFLRYYYTYCRSKLNAYNLRGETWSENESELGYAYYQYENAYDLPIENLMLNVFTLVLMAGRGPEVVEKNLRQFISDIMSKHSLDELIAAISEEEKKDLLYDMRLLGLIDEKH